MSEKVKILGWRNDWAQSPEGTEPLRGTGYYRVVKPLHFQRDWADTFIFGKIPAIKNEDGKGVMQPSEVIPWLIKNHDLMFMRNVSQKDGYAIFLGSAEHFDKPAILDMDDDYLNIDALHPERKYFIDDPDTNIIHELLFKTVTAITVATEPLAKLYEPFNKNIHVLKNYNDITEWTGKRVPRADGRVCIGWCGSTTHESDFEYYYPVMKELWKRYGKKIVFKFNGFAPVDLEELGDQLPPEAYEIETGTMTMLSYIKALPTWGYDIGVAPLKHSLFNDGKGHGKWIEYACSDIPMVGERFGPYERECKDGVDALLCNGVDEWVGAISRLIEDETERKRIADNARKAVIRDWQWKDNAWRWKEVFKQYLGQGFHK